MNVELHYVELCHERKKYDLAKLNSDYFYRNSLGSELCANTLFDSTSINSDILKNGYFLTGNELQRSGLLDSGQKRKACPVIGILQFNPYEPKNIHARTPLSYGDAQGSLLDGNGHIFVSASTRSGKSSSHVMYNALDYPGSLFILDIKGEIYDRSAGYRAKNLKQKVIRFAPFDVDTYKINLFTFIPKGALVDPSLQDLIAEENFILELVRLLIVPNSNAREPIWDASAENALIAFIYHVHTANLNPDGEKYEVHERSMGEVRRLFSLGGMDMERLLAEMSASNRRLVKLFADGLIGSAEDNPKYFDSVRVTVEYHTRIWSMTAIQNATYLPLEVLEDSESGANRFDFAALREGNVSFYLVIPPEKLAMGRALLRVMVGMALYQLRESYKSANCEDVPPVLFLLDEFPQLGRMDIIEDYYAYAAGYGVRFLTFCQNIGQLFSVYGDAAQTILANSEFKCFFGVNDLDTAEFVSKHLGEVYVVSYNTSNSRSQGPQNWNWGNICSQTNSETISSAMHSIPLLTAGQVMQLPKNLQIIFAKGLRPIICFLPSYYKFEELVERSHIPFF
ncbi:type IV secretory system conjugative DNA transfer family protein [Methylobacter sp. BlB1]|uniref:type IV secretory system conjugative DNA transfer family protein n=1 Tax=unclassified Methylobacter TaxID=2635283 RepID=UPI0018939AA6|nr:type IV secretory system conjugative DNA transfer family protein [Methylobacter sp. BlB1]MBF6650082.1 type IV secretory system conjugative DNA transfer family protein [Methylobacter sp. BlB1]